MSWSLNVECPSCGVVIDLAEDDDDRIFCDAIFKNKWEDLEGEEVYCKACKKYFQIEKVEY